MAGAPPAKSAFRSFPGAPPYPRQPKTWDEQAAKRWGSDLLRVLDQQVQPLSTVVYSATATYSIKITSADTVVIADTTAGAFTATLPPVALNVNKTVTVKNAAGAANVTLSGGGANIDGVATQVIGAGNALKVISNATAWYII